MARKAWPAHVASSALLMADAPPDCSARLTISFTWGAAKPAGAKAKTSPLTPPGPVLPPYRYALVPSAEGTAASPLRGEGAVPTAGTCVHSGTAPLRSSRKRSPSRAPVAPTPPNTTRQGAPAP